MAGMIFGGKALGMHPNGGQFLNFEARRRSHNPCRQGCGCDGDDFHDDGPVSCRCGRVACAEACEQCGSPLCQMCFECGGGFCDKHPDDDYQPPQETHYSSGEA